MGTVIGVDPEPVGRDVAFLLKVDGSIQKVNVPLDENGVPLQMKSMGWRMFLQDVFDLMFAIDGEELPDVPMHMWSLEDTVRLPSKFWNVTQTDPLVVGQSEVSWPEVRVPMQWMVKVFVRPYADPEEYYDKLQFNECAPLFSTSQYWRGDMLLVCFSENPHVTGPYGQLQEIVSPRELLENIPAALEDFWDVSFQTWLELQLAFAMATHHRLGMHARACVLDDNLLHMIMDTALAHKLSAQAPEKQVWDLRGVFHAMHKEWECDSEDEDVFTDEEEAANEDEDEEDEDEEAANEDGLDAL
jgi:hypothetical protein